MRQQYKIETKKQLHAILHDADEWDCQYLPLVLARYRRGDIWSPWQLEFPTGGIFASYDELKQESPFIAVVESEDEKGNLGIESN